MLSILDGYASSLVSIYLYGKFDILVGRNYRLRDVSLTCQREQDEYVVKAGSRNKNQSF